MTIGTYWCWIPNIYFADFSDRHDLMSFDFAGKFFTKLDEKIKCAHLASCSMDSDISGAYPEILFVSVRQNKLLHTFYLHVVLFLMRIFI